MLQHSYYYILNYLYYVHSHWLPSIHIVFSSNRLIPDITINNTRYCTNNCSVAAVKRAITGCRATNTPIIKQLMIDTYIQIHIK